MDTWHIIVVGLLAIMPISEVRGAIPYAICVANDTFSLITGVLVSLICNMLVAPLAFTILDSLDRLVRSKYTPILIKRFYNWLMSFGKKRALRVKRESYIALALFVGIPLPATGAWTGSLVAYVLGLDKKKSTAAIEIGVLVASLIVLVTAYTGIEVLSKLFLG